MEEVDIDIVKSYTKDLKSLLEESDITERKAFLRSFIKRIDINRDRVIVTNLFSYKKSLSSIDNTRCLQYNSNTILSWIFEIWFFKRLQLLFQKG